MDELRELYLKCRQIPVKEAYRMLHLAGTTEEERRFYSLIGDLNYYGAKELRQRIAEIEDGTADLQEHDLIVGNVDEWEYNCAYIALFPPQGEYNHSEILQEELNRYGADGWELVSISPGLLNGDYVDGNAIFKRKLND